jgi:phage terminase small subunit
MKQDKKQRSDDGRFMQTIPKATMPLKDNEQAFFEMVVNFLKKNKAVELVDAYQITQLAQSWGRYEFAAQQLADDPSQLIQTFEGGASNIGPMYSILERERAFFDKLAKNFGLNERSREALLCFKVDANQPGGIISKLTAIREKAKKVV